MATDKGLVRIISGALDESPETTAGLVLRGVLAPETLQHLKVDDYQREALPLSAQWKILDALKTGERLPDIELAVRGADFHTPKGEDPDTFVLKGEVVIVDGLQRVTSALHYLSVNPGALIRLGAMVHFNTTKEWERQRFHVLNTGRLKMSPNILLRNMREESVGVESLYSLATTDRFFVLYDRVSWAQRMKRGDLLTALNLLKVTGMMHSHKVAARRVAIPELVPALDKIVEVFGVNVMRDNIRTFFNLVDEAWGIKRVQYKDSAVHMRGTFLLMFARFLADHHDFWQGDTEKRLSISVDLKRKIATFPINDPEIARLSGSAGLAQKTLYLHLRDHVNSGKRTRRLTSRHPDGAVVIEEAEEDEEVSEEAA